MALKKEYTWVFYLSIMLLLAGTIIYDALVNKKYPDSFKSKKTVALVRVNRTVYHCEELKLSNCGYSAKCGADKFNCLSDLEFQLIK